MRRARRLATLLLAAVAVGLAAGCGHDQESQSAPRPSGERIPTAAGSATPYGAGAAKVWVLKPSERPVRNVVVYLHGWGATTPFEWHLAWFDHLLARGSAVIFPQYQPGSYDDPQVATTFDLRLGLRTGFAALGESGRPVVVAGFSFGACLAFFYAANAARWGVPAPVAVYSVFPTDPRVLDPTLDLPPLRRTRVLILVGADDTVVGRDGADTFWTWLEPVPRRLREYRVVASTDFLADHEAPTAVAEPAVRRAFWTPLDRLLATPA